jgi:malonyl CoA-acyl carrier protein transacylase
MTVVHLFPGQGSHQPGMGRDLFGRYPLLMRQADSLLGWSVEELCLAGTRERLSDTRYTQCAVYVVDTLTYIERVRTQGIVPDAMAGHSLGEYAALFAAGAFDFLTGLELVAQRAALMADAGPGAMAAVMGVDATTVHGWLAELSGGDAVDVANLNTPSQTVISGPVDAIEALLPALRDGGATAARLDVSGAFHSRYMASAAAAMGEVLTRYRFGRLKIPVVANVTAAPYADGQVAELLRRQITEPVRWVETLEHLLRLPEPEIVEVGPGQVLTRLLAQTRDHQATSAPM